MTSKNNREDAFVTNNNVPTGSKYNKYSNNNNNNNEGKEIYVNCEEDVIKKTGGGGDNCYDKKTTIFSMEKENESNYKTINKNLETEKLTKGEEVEEEEEE